MLKKVIWIYFLGQLNELPSKKSNISIQKNIIEIATRGAFSQNNVGLHHVFPKRL